MVGASEGTWRAREWARWACGLLSTVMAVYCLSGVQLAATRSGAFGVVEFSVVSFWCGWLAWYSLRRSMREDFHAVRDAIARARAVPG